jgi:hypothetical protein
VARVRRRVLLTISYKREGCGSSSLSIPCSAAVSLQDPIFHSSWTHLSITLSFTPPRRKEHTQQLQARRNTLEDRKGKMEGASAKNRKGSDRCLRPDGSKPHQQLARRRAKESQLLVGVLQKLCAPTELATTAARTHAYERGPTNKKNDCDYL